MAQGEPGGERVGAAALHEFARTSFERAGLAADEAAVAASVLVKTSLRGIDTHGIALLPGYVRALRSGRVSARPEMHFTTSGPSTAVLDADGGLGVLAAFRAMNAAIEMARHAGVGVVGVRRSSHFGAGAYYAMMAVPHRMIGIAASNGPPVMAPFGGRRAALHNMPIAAAVPAGQEPPVVMDFALSVAAARRIALAAEQGVPIPEGWALDAEGRPTTDPNRAREGAVLPLGHKGYALAVLIDILTGVLTGAGFGPHIPFGARPAGSGIGGAAVQGNAGREDRVDDGKGSEEPASPSPAAGGTGHLFVALNVAFFMRPAEFEARVDRLIRDLRSVPPIDPGRPVMVPGERSARIQQERLQQGVPVWPSLRRRLEELAEELGVPSPFERA